MRVLLVDPSATYESLLVTALGHSYDAEVHLVDALDDFEAAFYSAEWDAVVVTFAISAEPIRLMEAGEWETPLIILCDTQDEADQAYELTSSRINDVVMRQQLKRLQVIMRRELVRRTERKAASEIARQKSVNDSLQRSEARFRSVIEGFSDPILFVDTFQIVRYANTTFTKLFGYKPSQVLGKVFQGFIQPEAASTVQENLDVLLRMPDALQRFDSQMQRADGVWEAVEITAHTMSDPTEQPTLILHIEIVTERKRNEARIKHLNRTLSVLSDINQSIVRIRDLSALYKTACDIAVEKGTFKVAWIGLIDWVTRQIQPAGYAGMPADLVPNLTINIDDPLLERAPSLTAFRSGKRYIVNDIETELAKPEWRETAKQIGYGSSAALPLIVHNEVRGILHLFAYEKGFFSEDELRLVEEMAGDIAFAMMFAEEEAHRQQAESALLESESRYHQMMDELLEGCQILSPEWRYLYVNEVNAEQAGVPRNKLLGNKITDVFPGIENMPFFPYLEHSMRDRVVERTETEFFYADGTSRWFDLNIQPIPEGILILTLEMTQRKQSEAAMQHYAKRMEGLHEIDSDLIRGGSVQELTQNALTNIRQLIPYERADITMIDTETNTATVFAVNSDNVTTLGQGLQITISPSAIARFDKNRPLIVDDIRPLQDARPHTKQLVDEGLRSWLSVLLMDGETPIGLFSLFAKDVAFFKPEHAEIAAEVGGQLAIAIRQLRLSKQLEHRAGELAAKVGELEHAETSLKRYARRMEILHQIDNGIILATSTKMVVETAVRNIRQLIPCRRVGVNLIDEVKNELILYSVDTNYDSKFKEGSRISIPEGLFDGFDERYVRIIPDARLESGMIYQQLAREGVVSILQILLMDRNHPLGFMGLWSDEPDFFTPEYIEIGVQIAGQLAIAVHQLQLQEALLQSEERYREVIENQTDLICRYRPDSTLTFVNRAYCDMVKMEPEQLIGRSFYDIMPPLDRAAADAYMAQFSLAKPAAISEHQSRLPDGSLRWIQWKDRAIFDESGAIAEYQAVGRDITERKRMQAEHDQYTDRIEELSGFLQSALDAYPANTVVLDTDGKIISMNKPWKIFASENNGNTENFYAGMNYVEVCERAVGYEASDAHETAKGIRAVIAAQQDEYYLEYPCNKGHEEGWFAVRVTPFLEPAPRRVVVAHADITERRVSERELNSLYNATSYLFKADSLLNLGQQIVAAVVHEFQHTDCGLMLYDKKQKKIMRLARTGAFDIQPENPLMIDGAGLVPLALRTGKTVYVSNVADHPNYIPNEARTRSEIVIPLKTANGVIGVLDLQSAEIDAFSERDQRILLAYVERAAPAIENRQLYEEINQHAAVLEWRVAQRTAEVIYSKNRVEAILNNSTDGILLAYANTGIQQSNTMFNKLFACNDEDYFGQALSSLVPPEDRERLLKAADHVLTTQEAENIETLARRKDGTTFDAELGLGYIRTEENRERGVVCVIRDITKRKQAEQALQSKIDAEMAFQRYLKELHEITVDLTQIDDLDDFYHRSIELGLERLGFDRMALFLYKPETETAAGTYGTDVMGNISNEQDIEVKVRDFETLTRSLYGEDRFSFQEDVTIYFKGEPVGTGWQASAVLWDGSRSIGWLVVDNYLNHKAASKPLLDALTLYAITIGSLLNRKQTEASQRESEARYRLLAENISDVIVRTNRNGEIEYVSPSSYAVLGYQPDELVGRMGRLLLDQWVRIPGRSRFISDANNGEPTTSFSFPFEHKEGHSMWLEAVGKTVVSNATGEFQEFIASIRDITERKRAEEAVVQAYEKERELGELKSRFVSMASHEFRTPLANILAMTETLTNYRNKMKDVQITDRLGNITGQVDRLKDIMDDMLLYARMGDSSMEFQPLDLNLDAFCREVIAEYQLRPEHRHRIAYSAPAEMPLAKVDKKLMRQVLDNLLSNALKYSDENKSVEVRLNYENDEFTLSISDQGIGIPEPDLKHLFEPFHRATNVGTISGTGLGLVISKQAIELHSGKITVTSSVGQGTTMIVTIPLTT